MDIPNVSQERLLSIRMITHRLRMEWAKWAAPERFPEDEPNVMKKPDQSSDERNHRKAASQVA